MQSLTTTRLRFPICLTLLLCILAPLALALNIGEAAPDFTLKGVDNKEHTLSEYSNAKILVVVFTCNHCPTAQAYEDSIQQLHNDYKEQGVQLIAISPNDPTAVRLDELGYTDVNDSLPEMQLRALEKKFTYPYLYDGDTQKVSRDYKPVATPHVFIFDQDRKLRYKGRISDNQHKDKAKKFEARDAIEALLNGEDPPVTNTKTMGCSVKWSDKQQSVKSAEERWANEPVEVRMLDDSKLPDIMINKTNNLRLVNVWATWCGGCVAEFPELIEINRMYRNRDFELVTLSADEPDKMDQVKMFLEKQQASTTNYLVKINDGENFVQTIDPKWEGALPYTMLIAPGGEIIYRHEGIIDPLTVKRTIVNYLGRTYK